MSKRFNQLIRDTRDPVNKRRAIQDGLVDHINGLDDGEGPREYRGDVDPNYQPRSEDILIQEATEYGVF